MIWYVSLNTVIGSMGRFKTRITFTSVERRAAYMLCLGPRRPTQILLFTYFLTLSTYCWTIEYTCIIRRFPHMSVAQLVHVSKTCFLIAKEGSCLELVGLIVAMPTRHVLKGTSREPRFDFGSHSHTDIIWTWHGKNVRNCSKCTLH